MRLQGYVVTDVGNAREANQDSGFAGERVIIVADGMGGHLGGDVASSLVVSKFKDIEETVTPQEFVDIAVEANKAVHSASMEDELAGMGTTLVAMTLHDDATVSVVNIGDSRAYWLRGNYLAQVTNDHSFVQELIDCNQITPEEALVHPKRNILTRAVGIGPDVEVDRFPLSVEPGDRFLLCSDGLFNEISETEIARLLVETKDPQEAAQVLVDAVLETEARDNVTAAVIDVIATDDDDEISIEEIPTEDVVFNDEELAALESNDPYPPSILDENDAADESSEDEQVETEPTEESPALAEAKPVAVAESSEITAPEVEEITDVEEKAGKTKDGKKKFLGLFTLALLLFAITSSLYLGASWYNNQTWFIGQKGDTVAVFNGKKDGFLWLKAKEKKLFPNLKVSDLTEDSAKFVAEQKSFPSFEKADSFAQNLQVRVDDLDSDE